MELWNASDGRELKTLPHRQRVNGIAFSPGSATLATADDDTLLREWDSASGRKISELRGHTAVVECVAYSLDGKILAFGSNDGQASAADYRRRTPLWSSRKWGESPPREVKCACLFAAQPAPLKPGRTQPPRSKTP